ncbi:hypothetical protein Hanom_Chr02g00125031 [Helianthus anomalus]
MKSLYNIMQETLQVSRNAYNLGQSTSLRVGGMKRRITFMQSDISYIRELMVYQEDEDNDAGDDMNDPE